MGWEYRNGRQYYYRKHRRGKYVYSEYIGNGYQAEIVADQVLKDRVQANIQKEQMLLLVESNHGFDQAVEEYERFCEHLKEATLILAGFRLHKGEWRKRRHEQI